MITVIIPTYNREKTIRRSVESVLNQSYSDLEVIVVDDFSNDKTKQIIEDITDNRVKYECLDRNQGACVARNRGIELAKGEYIAFQDSDDVWHPNKLERQLEAIKKYRVDVCVCNLEKHFLGNDAGSVLFPGVKGNCFFTHRDMYLSPKAGTQTILAGKYVWDDIKFDTKVKKLQDYDWTIRASEKYSFYYLDFPYAIQYFQKDSISTSGAQGEIAARELFLEKYKEKFTKYPDFEFALLRSIASNRAFLGLSALPYLKRMCTIDKSLKNEFKLLLERMKLYSPIVKILRRNERLF